MESTGNVFHQSAASNCSHNLIFSSTSNLLALLFFLFFLLFLLPLFFITASSGDNVGINLTGQVDRTFPSGMKVCVDASGNGACDPGEPFGMTNTDGSYTILIPSEGSVVFPLIVEPAHTAKIESITLSSTLPDI